MEQHLPRSLANLPPVQSVKLLKHPQGECINIYYLAITMKISNKIFFKCLICRIEVMSVSLS